MKTQETGGSLIFYACDKIRYDSFLFNHTTHIESK